jgi:hypothetical protein
VDASSVVAS